MPNRRSITLVQRLSKQKKEAEIGAQVLQATLLVNQFLLSLTGQQFSRKQFVYSRTDSYRMTFWSENSQIFGPRSTGRETDLEN